MLDIKLETLLTVAECRNFTKAAEILSLTQPAVSHHITQLESQYGVKLFLRGRGDFRLTEEGKVAVKYAKRLKAIHDKMISEMSGDRRSLSRLRIGITHTSENNAIVEVLAKYVNAHPHINITITTDTINKLYDMLETYVIDIAIIDGKRFSQNLNYFMLDTDHLVCVIGNNNPLSTHSMVTIEQLKRENMILRLPSSTTRQLFEATLMSVNESIENFNVALEVDNVATIKDLVRKGLGVSVLPKSACMDELKKGELTVLPVENLTMMREMNIAYNKDFGYIDFLNDIIKRYQSTIKSI
ncbi:MAG: LysR family transcriptional regulator [Ruminococcaceae bacterium]|nr:LysR family transcriptional regulator [Oscillospiraceae bacterium]